MSVCLFTATDYHFWAFYVTVSIDWCLFDGQNFVRVILFSRTVKFSDCNNTDIVVGMNVLITFEIHSI